MWGPPDSDDGPVSDRATLIFDFDTTGYHQATGSPDSTATDRQCSSPGQALRRRRRASYRLVPLGATGNVRDPWQPWRAPLSECQVDGAVAAAEHLRGVGLVPCFDVDTLRAMWRAGHHQLVDELRGGAA